MAMDMKQLEEKVKDIIVEELGVERTLGRHVPLPRIPVHVTG